MRLGSWIGAVALAVLQVVAANDSASAKSLQTLLDEAKALSLAGRFNDALRAYEDAIATDASNYLTYFRRAAMLLNLGKTSSALSDFTKVLELKPEFDQALLQRGKLFAKECTINSAIHDLNAFLQRKPSDTSVAELVQELYQTRDALTHAADAAASGDKARAIELYGDALNTCPHAVDIRMRRAQLYLDVGDKEMAIGDFKRIQKLQPDSLEALQQLSTLHLGLGEVSESLEAAKDCLKQDPEHKACKVAFRLVKKLDKAITKMEEHLSSGRWAEAVKLLLKPSQEEGLMGEANKINSSQLNLRMFGAACKAFGEVKSMNWCTKTLELNDQSFDAYLYRAEAKVATEEYDAAMHDFQKAHELNRQDARASEGYHKAERLKRQAGRRDYYKVLGVPRSASKREIKKAFRKLAQEWHPDKYQGDLPEEAVVKKMSEINEAYEVLSDDELRQRFDNGDDPNVTA
ncbi:hypothetical protein BJ742DRAFT_686223 [Cladochytrium replicatum]|nr:hypothetical protein BJ742DRAFT_686223 [Cladochytrium replicatum]